MKESTNELDPHSGRTKPRKANSISDFGDPTSGRVTTQNTREGEMIYQLDGKDISFEDGFSLSVGRDKTPSKVRSSFNHISQDRWDKIFNRS
jgi:hypothetical protein